VRSLSSGRAVRGPVGTFAHPTASRDRFDTLRAAAPRERSSISSLPGLTRQSMLTRRLQRLSAGFRQRHFIMDHRVKPGGDEVREPTAVLYLTKIDRMQKNVRKCQT
jgi:hypothetical protein